MHLKQGSPEWLEMRKTKIGGSDAPIVMEESPWKTPYQLWQEKMGLVQQPAPTARMKRGLELEEQARHQLEQMTGLFLEPDVLFHNQHEYMVASLDGIDPTGKHIAEIKCCGSEDHAIALGGSIPQKYYPQLQHQLEVCQLDMALYFSYDGSQGVIVKVFRDDEYIKKMLAKEQQFWECMQSFEAPPMTERDYAYRSDPKWIESVQQLVALNNQLKDLEAQEANARKSLIELSEGKSTIGSGLKLTRSLCRGSVDYAKIPELSQVNLEIYRKKPIEKWRISEC